MKTLAASAVTLVVAFCALTVWAAHHARRLGWTFEGDLR